jgi:hypothetical protein
LDEELDLIIKNFKANHPSTGIHYIRGYLLQYKIRVQKHCIIQSIGCVDGINKSFRKHTIIKCHEYQSARPNSLWHIDGYHKLILWGIVIHGIVDGYN